MMRSFQQLTPNMQQYTPQYQTGNQMMPGANQMQQQIQCPFVLVRNEMEARNYPVAYGNSVTFKDETAPYVYSKTMGFSQLDKPMLEKYRLIEEEAEEEVVAKKDCRCNDIKDQVNDFGIKIDDFNMRIGDLGEQIISLWDEIDALKEKKKKVKDNEHS